MTSGIGGVASVIAEAKILAQEFDVERKSDNRRKKDALHIVEQDFVDLDGDGVDDRLEDDKDKGFDLSL